MKGVVYLLQCGAYYMISMSSNAKKRCAALSTATPFAVQVLYTIATDDALTTEENWHQRFADKRVQGECFRLGKHDVRASAKDAGIGVAPIKRLGIKFYTMKEAA